VRSNDPIAQGHYALKQIFSRSWLIAWSHRRRFDTALDLARGFAGRTVLDYGCGDGTFLALLMRADHPPRRCVGAEITEHLVADCRTRLGAIPHLSFILQSALEGPEHRGAYDAVVCMEVMEHVVEVDTVLDQLTSLLAPEGTLLISVPVETGPPLLVKQTIRRIAGWRGIGHYPGTTPYTWRELAAGLMAGARPHVQRVVHQGEAGPFHDHKGFNWMVLRDKLAARLTLEWIGSSPLRWLPPQLASQVWFRARRT
jgi:SAM-dependent methyltransferase